MEQQREGCNTRTVHPPLQFKRRIGRPLMGDRRRIAVSVTVDPGLIAAIDKWAHAHDLSRSVALEVLATSTSFVGMGVDKDHV